MTDDGRVRARRRLRNVLAATSLALVTTMVAGSPALAAEPVHYTEDRFGIVCEEPLLVAPAGSALVVAQLSDVDGPNAGGLFWRHPASPSTDEPTLRSTGEVPQVTVSGDRLDAVIPMETSAGEPAGSAIVVAHLGAVGEPEREGRSRNGNQLIRDDSVLQRLEVVSGSVTFPGDVTFDLTGCPGHDLSIDVFITMPSASVRSFDGVLVACEIVEETYSVELVASADDKRTGGRLMIATGDGFFEGHHGSLELTSDRFSGFFELTDDATGEPVGDAVVEADLTRRERVSLDASAPGRHSRITGWRLAVSGALSLPPTVVPKPIDLASCFALEGRQVIARTPTRR